MVSKIHTNKKAVVCQKIIEKVPEKSYNVCSGLVKIYSVTVLQELESYIKLDIEQTIYRLDR